MPKGQYQRKARTSNDTPAVAQVNYSTKQPSTQNPPQATAPRSPQAQATASEPTKRRYRRRRARGPNGPVAAQQERQFSQAQSNRVNEILGGIKALTRELEREVQRGGR